VWVVIGWVVIVRIWWR